MLNTCNLYHAQHPVESLIWQYTSGLSIRISLHWPTTLTMPVNIGQISEPVGAQVRETSERSRGGSRGQGSRAEERRTQGLAGSSLAIITVPKNFRAWGNTKRPQNNLIWSPGKFHHWPRHRRRSSTRWLSFSFLGLAGSSLVTSEPKKLKNHLKPHH